MFNPSTRGSARSAALPLLAATLCLSFALARPAGAEERGLPLITVFPPEVHKAGPQTFDIAQDTRGLLYFGNLHGLLSFDGAWWRLRKLPDDQVALSVAADAHGGLALGLAGDFGFLDRNGGASNYRSLLPLLPRDDRSIGDVTGVCSTPGGFLYVAEQSVLLWDGRNGVRTAKFERDKAPRSCFSHRGRVYLRGRGGLQQFDPSTMTASAPLLPGRIALAIPREDGTIIAGLRDNGLFIIDDSGASPFAPAASEWLKGKVVTGGCRLADGRVVIATSQNGVALLDPSGGLQQTIGVGEGLPDAIITDAHVDREGSLWLAMEGPIVRIDIGSPVSVLDSRRGLRGGAYDVARLRGQLYAAMTHGLYSVDVTGQAQRVPGVGEGAWRLLQIDDELIVGTSKGIDRIGANGVPERVIEHDAEIYDLTRSTADPSRVWIAQGDGLASMRRIGARWQYEGLLGGLDQDSSSVVEQDGVLWVGTTFNGVLRVTHPRTREQNVTKFGSGEMNVFRIGGRVVLVSAKGFVFNVTADGRLAPDPLLGHLSAPHGFFVLAETPGGVWMNSTPPRYFARQRDGSYAREGKPLVSVTATDIQNIRVDASGIAWFASDKGFFRYDPRAAPATVAVQPAPLIRRVVTGEDHVLFEGATTQGEPAQIRHDFGRIRIEFAPVSYRPGVSYEFRLDPIDTAWSAWTDQPFIDYTTLGADDYTFRVRARGSAMIPGAETRWAFRVQPPWYATAWAYVLWVLLAAAAVVALIRIRTASLHRQAERLRGRVAQQTAALQQTVHLLETANTQLEALSLEDELTGIANRRFFERALSDEWNRARRYEQPVALILIDLDHFKQLNDLSGHPAGDDCLRRIGAFLGASIRRSSDVVARYGGEEFAILLPAFTVDEAAAVAETLRDGIQRLNITYGSGRRVTASCGVAAMTPVASLSADEIVAAADRALYAAKHSGRNCVRAEGDDLEWFRNALA